MRKRTVVDTNLFVSGLIVKVGRPHDIVEAFRCAAKRQTVTKGVGESAGVAE